VVGHPQATFRRSSATSSVRMHRNTFRSGSRSDKLSSITHMLLSAGDKLGPYEILVPIGAGGMGEVYRARDNKLEREVAIKVLPATLRMTRSVSHDLTAKRRFSHL
jgi:serine/threonine protein kinase